MKKVPSTKKALVMSVLSLVLCFCMLAGTTYAWFTDSVTSSANKIVAGTLKIDLELYDTVNGWKSVKANKDPIFSYNLWEPGYTEVKLLKVENEGSLALKWKARFVSSTGVNKLAEVIDVYVLATPNQDEAKDTYTNAMDYPTTRDLESLNYVKVGTLAEFINTIDVTTNGVLEAGQSAYLAIALVMQTSAGNEYQGEGLEDFDIQIVATQYTHEEDSFDDQYDADAPFEGSAVLPAPQVGESVLVEVFNNLDEKMMTMNIPGAAVENPEEEIIVNIVPTETPDDFVVSAGTEAKSYDITVSNLKPGNTAQIPAQIFLGMGYDPATVNLYHKNQLIPSAYNPNDGYVTFQTTSFSPYTITYDAESEYVPPVVDPTKAPAAIVAEKPEYVGQTLPWGSYGRWTPTDGLESVLETAYQFTCAETFEQAKLNAYANWECDFFVKLDRALPANSIFLGGNYGSFGWIGFHNDDVVLNANEEVALLGSVTETPWTYLDVAQYVGTFLCGVGDVDDALTGATFTVTLRLTNPENKSETIDVKTINYTFKASAAE